MRPLLLFPLFACAMSTQSAEFVIGQDGLTGEQAKQVLIEVLKYEKFQLTKKGMDIDGPFKVDPNIPTHCGFWAFGLSYDSPKYGATQVLGQYAVSRFTGDVWETNLCKRFDFPKLRRMQAQITLKTAKSRTDEVEARRGLGCTDE